MVQLTNYYAWNEQFQSGYAEVVEVNGKKEYGKINWKAWCFNEASRLLEDGKEVEIRENDDGKLAVYIGYEER